jgi:hypothetical protein
VPLLIAAAGAAHPSGAVVYTDLDVVFMSDVRITDLNSRVRLVAGRRERAWPAFNTGVLWMNVSAIARVHASLVSYASKQHTCMSRRGSTTTLAA